MRIMAEILLRYYIFICGANLNTASQVGKKLKLQYFSDLKEEKS